MLSASLHKEDIKAQLRKRHGTLAKFASSRDLKPQAVADWLRGRTSGPVEAAIEAELVAAQDDGRDLSINLDDSVLPRDAHRLIAGGR